jgi:hypothetical protein
MLCRQCGANVNEVSTQCPGCGAPMVQDDPWAPPGREAPSPMQGEAPFGYSAGGSPRRVSLFSKLALVLACIVPPLGFVLGIVASVAARKYSKRPGNTAVALASIFASLHVGIIWGAMLAMIYEGTTRYDEAYLYDDPFAVEPVLDPLQPPIDDTDPAGLQANPEFQKLLEQLMQAPDGGVMIIPPSGQAP